MIRNKSNPPVCSFCGAKKGEYEAIYKSNSSDAYICKDCTRQLAMYSGVLEEALKRAAERRVRRGLTPDMPFPEEKVEEKVEEKNPTRCLTATFQRPAKFARIWTTTSSAKITQKEFYPLPSTTITNG